MGVSRTKTVKNKHAANSSGIKGSKSAKRLESDPVVKARKTKDGRPPVKPGQLAKDLQKKRRRKVYSEKDLGIPELNMVTPIGVQKPKGKKKGKVFVDDRVCLSSRHLFFLSSSLHYSYQKKNVFLCFYRASRIHANASFSHVCRTA